MRSNSDGSSVPSAPKSHPCDVQSPSLPGRHSTPTTFFLRSEREMRQTSLQSDHTNSIPIPTPTPQRQETGSHDEVLADSMYGVQSLESTLAEAFPPHASQVLPVANGGTSSHALATDQATSLGPNSSTISPRKRRIGRSIHPKIAAAAQRIISSEHTFSRTSSISSSKSPRSISTASRDPSSTSLTPLGINSGMPSSPRSGSVRSLVLSDGDCSVVDDCGSQVIHSSSEDEETAEDRPSVGHITQKPTIELLPSVPQLVMPSLSMPKRRPFTDRGSRIGRLKLLVMGPSQTGKTSLIRSVLQSCEDIVHVDLSNMHWQADLSNPHTDEITEINASTKALPSWWSDVDEGRGLKRRRSMGAAVLDRNLCFVDTPGWDSSGSSEDEHMQVAVDNVIAYIEESLVSNMSLSQLGDSELLGTLCGGGGLQVDLIIYVFRPNQANTSRAEVALLRRLSQISNILPVIGKSDTAPDDQIQDIKAALRTTFDASGIEAFSFHSRGEKPPGMIYAVTSALKDDSDIMDASLLMSPDYSPPLISSDLPDLVDQLFEPGNIQWLKHCAVKKFLRWRREHAGHSLQGPNHELRALCLRRTSSSLYDGECPISLQASATSSPTRSSPSGVLVPRSSSPFFSPGSRDSTSRSLEAKDGKDFAGRMESCSQMYIAGWASDLQRALCAERRRLSGCRDSGPMALSRRFGGGSPSRRGRLPVLDGNQQPVSSEGLGVAHGQTWTNMQDPLGLLALGEEFSRRGWLALQIVGGCSVLATAALWMMKHWCTATDIIGSRSDVQMAVPGHSIAGSDLDEWREMLFGGKW